MKIIIVILLGTLILSQSRYTGTQIIINYEKTLSKGEAKRERERILKIIRHKATVAVSNPDLYEKVIKDWINPMPPPPFRLTDSIRVIIGEKGKLK